MHAFDASHRLLSSFFFVSKSIGEERREKGVLNQDFKERKEYTSRKKRDTRDPDLSKDSHRIHWTQ